MKNRMIDELTAAARRDGRSGAGAVGSRQETDGSSARETLGRWTTRIGETVAEHPAVFLGAAVAAGVALGWWVKRR